MELGDESVSLEEHDENSMLACFTCLHRTRPFIQSGLGVPTSTKQPTDLPAGQFDSKIFLNEVPSSQNILACVKSTKSLIITSQ